MAQQLVTVEDFSGYLKRDFTDADAYTAQLMIDGAAEAVIEYCGWHIAPIVTETLTVDGTGLHVQTLPTLNLVWLNSIAEHGVALDITRIDFSANGLLEKRSGQCWTRRRRGVVTEVMHGYESTPRWVATLIYAVAGRAFNSPPGVLNEAAGGESIEYTAPKTSALSASPPGTIALMAFEKKMLDRIRVPLAA
jgi:hypothetical protein